METDIKEKRVSAAEALAAACSISSIAAVPAQSEVAKRNSLDDYHSRRTLNSKAFKKKKKARKAANKARKVNRNKQ